MYLDSLEKKVIWSAAMLGTIGLGLEMSAFSGIFFGILFFSLGMIFLNLALLMEGKTASVFGLIVSLSPFAAFGLVPQWFIGATGLLLLSVFFFHRKRLCRFLGIGLVFVSWILQTVLKRPSVVFSFEIAGILLLAYLLWEVSLFFLRQNVTSSQRLSRALTASAVDAMEQRRLREEIARTQSVNEHNARLQERERISRDIHNYVGHTLSAATVTLDAAAMLVPNDQDRAVEKIETANSRVHEAISSVRSVVRTLDADDDKILLLDYMKSLENMVAEFMMDTDIKVYHNFRQYDQEEARIPMQAASFISSSLSELLTNGVKHGKAKIFVVTFLYDTKNIRLSVQDNGTGWGEISAEEKRRKISSGFGLRKMMNYAETRGGSLTIESTDGFSVNLSLPLEG